MRKLIVAAASLVALASPLIRADVAEAPAKDPALAAAVAGDWRSAEHKARDRYRHPQDALQFWGLEPGMAVLEIQPGNPGWWTEILAPYAKATGGSYTATAADLANPELSDGARKGRTEFEATYAAKPQVYGKVNLVNWGPKSAPLPADRFDLILTARSVHGWMSGGNYMAVDKAFREFHRALKPGGILAVEQHRANPGPQGPKADGGYVTEAYVIEQAEKAGFKLDAKSEINANPKDTKDHPFGVWTLPPSRQSSEDDDKPSPAGFDRAKYDAIGESDRMTLRFRKAG
jgi:predicted methyltransferase